MMSSGRTAGSELGIKGQNYRYTFRQTEPPWLVNKGFNIVNVNGTFLLENYKIFHLDTSKYDSLKALELHVINLVELSSLEAEDGKLGSALEYAYKSQEIFERLKVKVKAQERSGSSLSIRSGSSSISNGGGAENGDGFVQSTKDNYAATTHPLTTGVNLFELSVMVNSNLATQLKNSGRLDEALDIYFQMVKLVSSSGLAGDANSAAPSRSMFTMNQTASSSSNIAQQQYQHVHRFGLNIGNIYSMMGEHQRALKYYRLTLDRLSSSSQVNLRIKLMHNIAVTLITMIIDRDVTRSNGMRANGRTDKHKATQRLAQSLSSSGPGDPVTSLNMLLADNLSQQTMNGSGVSIDQQRTSNISLSRRIAYNANHHQFGLNLVASLYNRSDLNSMLTMLKSLLSVDICHHYECVLQVGHNNNDSEDFTNNGQTFNSMHLTDKSTERGTRWQSTKSAGGQGDTRQQQQPVTRSQHNGRYSATRQYLGVHRSPSSSNDQVQESATGALPARPGLPVSQDDSVIQQTASTRRQLIGHMIVGTTTPTTNNYGRDVKQIVMNHISTDALEQLIKEKQGQISRSLLVSCNLILDLSQRLAATTSSISTNRTPTKLPQAISVASALDTCCNLFAQSSSYKCLAFDLKMNHTVTELANCRITLKEAIETVRRLEPQAFPSRSTQQNLIDRPQTAGNLSKATPAHGLSSMTLTNLSWSTYLAGDYSRACQYAEQSIQSDVSRPPSSGYDRRNVPALINLANCCFANDDPKSAEKFLELALQVDEDHPIANYNSLIFTRRLGYHYDDLDPSVKRLLRRHSQLTDSKQKEITTMTNQMSHKFESTLLSIQSGLILHQSNLIPLAAATFDRITKTTIGARQGPEVYLMASRVIRANSSVSPDTTTAYPAAQPSVGVEQQQTQTTLAQVYRWYQYCLPLAERMIALHIDGYDYKSAQLLLKDCIKNRPNQAKWYQMLAECHRRAADYGRAIEIYKYAVDLFPSNTSFPRALIRLTEELGMTEESRDLQKRYFS